MFSRKIALKNESFLNLYLVFTNYFLSGKLKIVCLILKCSCSFLIRKLLQHSFDVFEM